MRLLVNHDSSAANQEENSAHTLAAYIFPIEKCMTTVSGDALNADKAISMASLISPALCKMLARLRSGICCNNITDTLIPGFLISSCMELEFEQNSLPYYPVGHGGELLLNSQ